MYLTCFLVLLFVSSAGDKVEKCDTKAYTFPSPTFEQLGTAVAQRLRRCATNQKVAGSNPNGVIGIFHWHNPSDLTMARGRLRL
jgi:hypothetical protein